MLMIRFQRIGRRNDPAFRIAVLEKTAGPKAGKYVELVGTYNPKTKETNLKPERIKDWISKGAQVSPSLHNLLVSKGVYEAKKINVLPKKTVPVKETVPEVTPAPAAEAPPEIPETIPAAEEVVSEVPAEMPTEAEVEVEAVDASPEEESASDEAEAPAAE